MATRNQIVVSHPSTALGRWCPSVLTGGTARHGLTGRRLTRMLTSAERANCTAAVARADRDVAITVLRRTREDRYAATPAPVRHVASLNVASPVDRIERTWIGNLALAVLVMLACGWAAWSAADRLLPRHASASTPTIVAPDPVVDAISGGSLDLQ